MEENDKNINLLENLQQLATTCILVASDKQQGATDYSDKLQEIWLIQANL